MKFLFLDRDGCLIREPEDQQVDSLEKLELLPDVIWALQQLKKEGFRFLLVSNQDGLGTKAFPQEDFEIPHSAMLKTFSEAGITFDRQFICPHFQTEDCLCRKPRVSPDIVAYMNELPIPDRKNSWMIGDRDTDLIFAQNLKINGIQISPRFGWKQVSQKILSTITS